MINTKRIRQGRTIWIVRLDTESITQRSECVWVIIPYLVMSENYVRAPSCTVDRRINIKRLIELIDCQDTLRYGVFSSRRAAEKFKAKITKYWQGSLWYMGGSA